MKWTLLPEQKLKPEDSNWTDWDPMRQPWDDTFVLLARAHPREAMFTLWIADYSGIVEILFQEVEEARINLRRLPPSAEPENETGYPLIKKVDALIELTIIEMSDVGTPILRVKYKSAIARRIKTPRRPFGRFNLRDIDTFEL